MSAKKKPRECNWCGGPTEKQRKHCSIDCLSAARQKIGQITCGNCGEIYIMPQWRVDQGRVYCSLSCKNEGQRK